MDTLWQVLIALLVVVVTLMVGLKMYVEAIKGRCSSTRDLTGKVVVVTGANTGIGFCTAENLALRNARVILACRNEKKAKDAVQRIRAATGNKEVVYQHLDISLLSSVRTFVKQFLLEESRLDILINNAGVAGMQFSKTEEGFETTFVTNYLGHFLLTNLLLDKLKQCGPSRVVNVSSMVHNWSKKFHLDDMNGEKSYSIQLAYYNSKLANILFTRELARRSQETEMKCYCAHPGCVKSDLLRHLPWYHIPLKIIIEGLIFKTSEEGAQTSIYCAVSEDVAEESGKYYVDCRQAEDQASDTSRDMGLARKLWEYSERVTGLATSDN
ncbi:retinol dehydrogenase 12-like isoform X2 [Mya arenaria]|uniref:retinol dehydrogenase 12-like isoform X2 n=1 Tax=Mya arenaria TaxID=6604 RepID=UPI0022E1ECB4|nr:retinol dehydrogenase 12-like isoform X2 [Mya arenaria]